MKSGTLIQGLKRVSLFRPLVTSFRSKWTTRWAPAIRRTTDRPRLHRASTVSVSTATLGRLRLTATNCGRPEKRPAGNRLTIIDTWIAPLIVWLIAIGMSLAIVAVALLSGE